MENAKTSLRDHSDNEILDQMTSMQDIVVGVTKVKFAEWGTLLPLLIASERRVSPSGTCPEENNHPPTSKEEVSKTGVSGQSLPRTHDLE